MPEQFNYPDTGWSTGRMRKNGTILGTGEEPQQTGDFVEQQHMQVLEHMKKLKVNPKAFEQWLALQPLSENIEDRRKSQEQMPKGQRGVW